MQLLPTINALNDDSRGVSEVLGAVLVFALVLLLLMLVQVYAVPVANQQLEFEHSKRALDDVQTFDLVVDRAASTGLGGSASIEAGVRYPTRLFLLNPGPASGTVRTTGNEEFQLNGFVAANPETADYLDATATTMPFATTSLVYDPAYNEYDNAPVTHYESGLVYDVYDDGTLVRDAGAVVSGKRITLVALEGSMSTASVDNIVLQAVPISAPTESVAVNTTGTDPSIVVYTGLSENQWRNDILAQAIDSNAPDPGNDRYVSGIECLSGADDTAPCDGLLRITFEPDETYDLRLAKVGIGDEFDEEPAWYLTSPQTGIITVPSRGSQELVVVARDQFNNPVSGVAVNFTVFTDGAGSFDGTRSVVIQTDDDGLATAVFDANFSFDGGSVDVKAVAEAGDLGNDNGALDDHEIVDFAGRLQVSQSSDDGDEGDLNPNSPDRIRLIGASPVSSGGGDSTVTLTFQANADEDIDIVGGRLNYHSAGGPGKSSAGTPAAVTILDGGTVVDTLEVSGPYVDWPADPVSISAKPGSTTITLEWTDPNGDPADIDPDHFYVLTLVYPNGDTDTYFISHPASGGGAP